MTGGTRRLPRRRWRIGSGSDAELLAELRRVSVAAAREGDDGIQSVLLTAVADHMAQVERMSARLEAILEGLRAGMQDRAR